MDPHRDLACQRTESRNFGAMGTGVWQYPGEFGRKMGLSGYCITLDLWENSFYSSYTLWDSYVCDDYPKIRDSVPFSKMDLPRWRVLIKTDDQYEWPGDEWGTKPQQNLFWMVL